MQNNPTLGLTQDRAKRNLQRNHRGDERWRHRRGDSPEVNSTRCRAEVRDVRYGSEAFARWGTAAAPAYSTTPLKNAGSSIRSAVSAPAASHSSVVVKISPTSLPGFQRSTTRASRSTIQYSATPAR